MRINIILLFLTCNFASLAIDNQCSEEYIDLELMAESTNQLAFEGKSKQVLDIALELDSLLDHTESDISVRDKVYLVSTICSNLKAIEETKTGIEIFEKYIKFAERELESDSYELAKLYESGGVLYEYMKDYDNAKHYLFNALDILKNHSGESDIYFTLAWYNYTIEKNNLAVKYFNKGFEEFDYEDQSIPNLKKLMKRYLMCTGSFIRMRNYGTVLKYLHKAEHLNKIIKDDHNEFYLNVKLAEYFLIIQNPQEALVYLSRDIPESQKDTPLVSTYNFYSAYAKYQTKDYVGAIEYYTKSLNSDLASAAEGNALRIRDIAENYKQIGHCYHELCEYESALKNLETSADYLKNNEGYHTSLAETYSSMSDVYFDMSDLEKALEFNFRALEIQDEDLIGVIDRNFKTAVIYLELFKENSDYRYADSIIHLMDKNDVLINDIRHNQRFYEESAERESLINMIYTSSLGVLNILNGFDKRDHIVNKIFLYMEGVKSYKLKKELLEKEGLVKYGISEKILNSDLSYKQNINLIQKEIYKIKQDSSLINSLSIKERELDDLKNEYHRFLKDIELNHSNYYEFKYDYSHIDLNQLQNKLTNNEAIIEYFNSDESLYVLSITANESNYYDIRKPDDWDILILDYVKSVSDPNYLHQDSLRTSFDLFSQASSKLYNIILKDVISDFDADINSLVFIPDNDLHFIQFDNLITSDAGNELDFKNLDYLINDFTSSRASSSFIFSQLRQKDRHRKKLKYLGVAPLYYDDRISVIDSLEVERQRKQEYYNDLVTRGSVVDLPLARESVSLIANILNGNSIIGKEATKFSLIKNVDKANIFHFAGHAIVDVEDPRYSQLLFPHEEIDSQLYATDIYDIDLNIDLAVLSACNTGNGKFDSGEGVMSLSRAFEFAGCSSLVMSLWNIPDVQTAEIDLHFFDNIQKGERIDDALRNSKLKFLESATYQTAHPFYWSGLTASGKMEPVNRLSLLDRFCNFLKSVV